MSSVWIERVLTECQTNPIGLNNERYEILTAVNAKITVFWDITPFNTLRVNRRLGRTYSLHLQGRKISRARKKVGFPPAFTLVSCLTYFSILKMEAIRSSGTSVDV
jgi:hypothetical protein